MQKNLNTQKIIPSIRGVLAHSEVTSAKKSGDLGNDRKECASLKPNIDKNPALKDPIAKRNQVFKLQKISADSLKDVRFKRDKPASVCSCCKHRNGSGKAISVKYNSSKKKASYANLFRCNSVWLCPVCAKRVSEYRRDELLTVSEKWQAGDFFNYATRFNTDMDLDEAPYMKQNSIFLATFTVRHKREDSLEDLLFALKENFRKLVKNRPGRRLLAKYGIAHNVKSLEVTYGNGSGWHPHFHVLFYGFYALDKDQMKAFQDELAKLWMDSFKGDLEKFKPDLKHGVDVADGSYASTYINKFGETVPCRRMGEKVDLEMTKSHMKKARENDRFTPFEMLEYFEDLPYLKSKYVEYAKVFFASAQLRYSKGFKNLMRIVDLNDEQILDELDSKQEQEDQELFNVNKDLFDILYINNLRGEFLAMVEIDIKKDGPNSNFKNTNRLIRTAITHVFSKLQIALDKTEKSDFHRIKKIKDRITSCIGILQNPLVLGGGQGEIPLLKE